MAPRYGSKERPYLWPLKKDIVGGQEGWIDPRIPDIPTLLPTKHGRIIGELDIRRLHRQLKAEQRAKDAWFRNTVKSSGGPKTMRKLLREQARQNIFNKKWSLLNQQEIGDLLDAPVIEKKPGKWELDLTNVPKRITNKQAQELFAADEAKYAKTAKIAKKSNEEDLLRIEALKKQQEEDEKPKQLPKPLDNTNTISGRLARGELNKSQMKFEEAKEKAKFEIPYTRIEEAGGRQAQGKGSIAKNKYMLRKRKYEAAAGSNEVIMNEPGAQQQTAPDGRVVVGWKMSNPPQPIYADSSNSLVQQQRASKIHKDIPTNMNQWGGIYEKEIVPLGALDQRSLWDIS